MLKNVQSLSHTTHNIQLLYYDVFFLLLLHTSPKVWLNFTVSLHVSCKHKERNLLKNNIIYNKLTLAK